MDHKTLEAIRLMAVERVREGEAPADVIASYGFNRTTIYKWVQASLQPGLGIRALHSTKATGRPRSLTPRQEAQVFRWINGRDPRQYGLDFGLWTRSVGQLESSGHRWVNSHERQGTTHLKFNGARKLLAEGSQ